MQKKNALLMSMWCAQLRKTQTFIIILKPSYYTNEVPNYTFAEYLILVSCYVYQFVEIEVGWVVDDLQIFFTWNFYVQMKSLDKFLVNYIKELVSYYDADEVVLNGLKKIHGDILDQKCLVYPWYNPQYRQGRIK